MNNKVITACAVILILVPTVHGQDSHRQQVGELIAALEKDRSRIVDLVKLTGRDFGLRPSLWKTWLAQTSNEQLVRIMERQRRAEELDKEWHRFAMVFADSYFARFRGDADEEQKTVEKLKRVMDQSKEPAAWSAFAHGCATLQSCDEAAKAGRHFWKVFRDMPLSHYADTADELAFLLEKMSQEDKTWAEPKDPNKLSRSEKVRYYVHHLRNVQVEQTSQPGRCHVLRGERRFVVEIGPQGELRIVADQQMNAAVELMKMSKDAIPVLLDLLDDRHPIRSVGYWRGFWPERTVLRYQDAAAQILDDLLLVPFFSESKTGYLSTDPPEARYELIARVRKWYKDSEGKSEAEQLSRRPSARRTRSWHAI